MSADTAPAAMPGVIEVTELLISLRADFQPAAAALAVCNLFATILAGRDAAVAKQAEFEAWLEDLADNPPEPNEALKKLFADYQAAGIKSLVTEASWESRALAAEAALAAERERHGR